MGPYLFLYAVLVGFFAFAAFYHAVLWSVDRREPLLAVFSLDCAVRAALCWSLVSILSAQSTDAAYDAVALRIALVLLMMIAATWSVRLLSGVRATWLVWTVTIGFASLFVVQAFVKRLNPVVTSLDRTTLPWGEVITTPVTEFPGWWVAPMLALGFVVQFFSIYCGAHMWRRDRVSSALVVIAAMVTVTILSLESLRTFRIYVAPLLGAFPNILWVGVIALLIARNHRQTRKQLAASEQRFRGIFDQTFQFIGLMRTDGTLIQANRTALESFNLREAEVIDRPFWETPWWSHSAEMRQRLREAVRSAAAGTMVRFEATHPRPDGKLIHVDFSLKPVRDVHGQVALLIPEGRDISQRKQAEEMLRGSEARTRAILQAIPDLMFRLDHEGRILDYFASRPEELLLSPEEFLGRRIQEVLPPEIGASYFESVHAVLDERRSHTFEYVLELPQLGPTHFEARMVPCDSSEIVTIVRNVTELKSAEANRRKLETQLAQSQKMEAVGRLAGGIAHDFNNLLTVINGNSEMLLNAFQSSDPRRSIVGDIHDAGIRAATLTRQLLTFSRRQVLETRVVDLNAVVTDAERMLGRLIGDHIRLEIRLDSRVARVKADPIQLDQVVMNLAVNARDAMAAGGRLTIRTELRELAASDIADRCEAKPGRYVVLEVTDTGCGMSRETQSRIFEPFFTTKGPGQGTGLGLAMVGGVASQCGGFVAVETQVNRGTVFQIFFPEVDEPIELPPPPVNLASSSVNGETILLVEDDDAVRALTRAMLREFGYDLLEAAGGPQALQLAAGHQGKIDLLVTDVVMPEMSGRALAERLQAIRPELKTLYLSGYTDDRLVISDAKDEATMFLQKPFTIDALASKVRHLLDGALRKAG
jgi:PAS domain S-box-containing protein